AGVFEAGWSSAELMRTHRAVVAADHRGRGREVVSLDWTQAHHERGPQIYGVKEAYDYVNRRESLFQTVVTAVVSNRELVDGLAVEVQQPDFSEAEMEDLVMTGQEIYTQMEKAQKRERARDGWVRWRVCERHGRGEREGGGRGGECGG